MKKHSFTKYPYLIKLKTKTRTCVSFNHRRKPRHA